MSEPKGDIVTGPPAIDPATKGDIVLQGDHNIILIPTSLDHASGLFETLSGPQNNNIYTYLPFEPFKDVDALREHLKILMSPDAYSFTIFSISVTDSKITLRDPIGLILYMNISVPNRSIEIGHVVFGPKLARTAAATEVNYLLMKYAFEELHFQRVEWKCNDYNEPSKRAALRLGFVFEGVFRKHMVVKGKRRDTWWASVVDDEWEGGVKRALDSWLGEENFDGEGRQRRRLENFRGGK